MYCYFFDLQSTTTSAHKVDYVQLSYIIIFNSIHLTFLYYKDKTGFKNSIFTTYFPYCLFV